MSTTVILFDPTAPREYAAQDEAQTRLAPVNLFGAVVGFIDNAKPNFHHLVDDLADLLTSKYGVQRTIVRRKSSASVPATPDVVAELASVCDVVITGSGD
jgi:hypothetical protein